MFNTNLIGICGREGAGKTTITGMICNSTENVKYFTVGDSLDYVISILYNVSLTSIENTEEIYIIKAKKKLLKLFRKFIDTEYEFPKNVQVPDLNLLEENKTSQWKKISFAEPLKAITSAVLTFNYNDCVYEMLLGVDEEARKKRETVTTINYNICGALTGRRSLEYLGTDVFRKNFNDSIWVNIAEARIKNNIKNNVGTVVSDLRFYNEYEMLTANNAVILLVYRKKKDLLISENDRSTHISKWQFLTFTENSNTNIIKIKNSGTLSDLYGVIQRLFKQ